MADTTMLNGVKYALGVTGDYQDNTLNVYINEVIDFLKESGVSEEKITSGIVSIGVGDLWQCGAGGGRLSTYFLQRATQLAYK